MKEDSSGGFAIPATIFPELKRILADPCGRCGHPFSAHQLLKVCLACEHDEAPDFGHEFR